MTTCNTKDTQKHCVRESLRARLNRYLSDHEQRLAWAEHDRANRRQGERVKSPAPIPPLAIRATVGLGKSHAARQVAIDAQKAGLPVLILVPTRDLVDEYVNEINAAGGHATPYIGRQPPPQAGEEPGPHVCWQRKATEQAGDRNHRPAQSICKECKHGRVSEYMISDDEQRHERAKTWLIAHEIKIEQTQPCRFLYEGLPDQLKADLLVAPVQAFSDALGIHDKGKGKRTQRLIIVDEQFELSTPVDITAADAGAWLESIRQIVEQIKDNTYINDDDRQALLDAYNAASHALNEVMRGLTDKQHTIDISKLNDAWKKSNEADLLSGGTARWERINYDADSDKYYIPLRALSAIRSSLKTEILGRKDGLLTAYEISPILTWAKRKGSTIFLDATLPLTMRSIVESAQGEVYDATIDQHMHVVRVTGHNYARGPVRKAGYTSTAQAAVKDYIEFCKQFTQQYNDRRWAAITHMAHLVYSRQDYDAKANKREQAQRTADELEQITGVAFGWHGRHSRGHNNWSNRHLAVFGHTLLGHDESENRGSLADAYARDRSAMISAGIEWEQWDGKMQKQDHGIPLPNNDHVRCWLLDMYAAETAQTIGRARAANADADGLEIEVRLVGGIQTKEMDDALAKHGVTVHERIPNKVHKTNAGRPPGADDQDIIDAIITIAAAGRVPTRRGVMYSLKKSGSLSARALRIDELIRDFNSKHETKTASQNIRSAIFELVFYGHKPTIDLVSKQMKQKGKCARRQTNQQELKSWKESRNPEAIEEIADAVKQLPKSERRHPGIGLTLAAKVVF